MSNTLENNIHAKESMIQDLQDKSKHKYSSASAKIPKGANPNLVGKKFASAVFNDYKVISLRGGNYPLTDEEDAKHPHTNFARKCTAIDLCNNPLGASIYMPRDFLLCARYGLPVNRMITLRRFPIPVGDNITTILRGGSNAKGRGVFEPDMARMVTYFDDEINKLSDTFGLSYSLSWKQLEAKMDKVSMPSSSGNTKFGIGGMMGKMAAYFDGAASIQAVQGENRLNFDPMYDNNKVYGPVDSIAKTNIRDVGLDNQISYTIVFDYELRSIDGLNQKAMFIDLLSNILTCTFNDGRFWGGARVWTGERPSSWMRKLQFMNPASAEDFFSRARQGFTDILRPLTGGKTGKEAALEVLRNVAMNGMNLALGKILDAVGRPAILAFDSLLSGNYTGEWHLTVGNPYNPIISMGNLIMKDAKIEFGDDLGWDDFPTSLKVTVTLEPGMPRDRAGIESMFNAGMGRTYWQPSTILKGKTKSIMGASGLGIKTNGSVDFSPFGEFDEQSIQTSASYVSTFSRTSPGGSDGEYDSAGISVSAGESSIESQSAVNASSPSIKPDLGTIPQNNSFMKKVDRWSKKKLF